MSHELAGLALFIVILLAGFIMHSRNLNKAYEEFQGLCKNVNRPELFQKLSRPQGTNFTALIIATWMLVIAALFYLFFFEPITGIPINYFSLITLFSGPVPGLEIIMPGMLILLVFGLVTAAIARFRQWPYGFYSMSRRWMSCIYIPIVLLFISIMISIYLGIIYPETQESLWWLALLLLIASEAFLLLPFISVAGRVSK
jgi:hypothetical protein